MSETRTARTTARGTTARTTTAQLTFVGDPWHCPFSLFTNVIDATGVVGTTGLESFAVIVNFFVASYGTS